MGKEGLKEPNRRVFLLSASAAAVTGFVSAEVVPVIAHAGAQNGTPLNSTTAPEAFQVITAETIQNDVKTLQAVPGNKDLVTQKEFSVALTTETAHSAKEFEWHEGRDHILQVIDGTTVYELGGTPKDPHSTKSGEWLAPASDGAAIVTLHKGDMLIIPRGMPHKRSTAGSVTFTLISPSGVAKS
jgi:quercetin dioxygenase-like cupin family protein